MRTTFLIDGFNLYHSLVAAHKDGAIPASARWLDIRALCSTLLNSRYGHGSTLEAIHWFSAIRTHLDAINPDYTARHRRYIRCLEESGVEVHFGSYKSHRRKCVACNAPSFFHEEKETDVAIAIHALDLAQRGACERIVIVSGDTDLAPAVRMANLRHYAVPIVFAFPWKRKNNELEQLAQGSFKISAKLYPSHQFPDPFIAKDGSQHPKPPSW